MNLLYLLYWVIIGGFSLLTLHWIYRISASYIWMKRSRAGKVNPRRPVYILIPVLREVGRIEGTVRYFLDTFERYSTMRVVLITTQVERREGTGKDNDTIDVAKQLSRNRKHVMHVHYPYEQGNMASQLNYAMKHLTSQGDLKHAICAVYNADSRPHPSTLDYVLWKAGDTDDIVLQQYGDYTRNITSFAGLSGLVLRSAACWQNRWIMGFEIYHALKQFIFRKVPSNLLFPMNYCIGHGLFFTRTSYEACDGFSEETHNEDAIFGLTLNYLKRIIHPVPFPDLCDSPDSLTGLYVQKSNWFYGPFQAFTYIQKIRQRFTGVIEGITDHLYLYTLGVKLFFHAIYWVVGPTMAFIALIVPLILGEFQLLLLSVGVLFAFLVIPNTMGYALMKRISHDREKHVPILRVVLDNLCGAVPCYWMHGLSAYRTICNETLVHLSLKKRYKDKTPMRQAG